MNKHYIGCMLGVLFLGACSPSRNWQFETDYLRVELNDKGYITSMQNRTVSPQREFSPVDKPSPLLSIYNEETKQYVLPESAAFDASNKTVTLTYPNQVKAEVRLEEKGKYLRMELLSLSPREQVDAIQWGTYYTNITNLFGEIIGVARDTSDAVNYSIGLLALDDNTLGGTADLEGDAAPFQYVIHTPDKERYPLPDSLHEGQVFSLGGNGISDVAFYAHKEPYYRILYGNAAVVDEKGQISLNYFSRDRSKPRQILYSLIPHMPANIPNHIDVEPLPGVDYIGSSIALWGSPDSTALMDVIQDIVLKEGLPYPTWRGKWVKDPTAYKPDILTSGLQYDSIVSYASQLGVAAISAYDQGFLRPDRGNEGYIDGRNYEKKPFRMQSGNLSHREMAEKAREKGILLGRTPITNSLAPGTKDVFPIPSDSLCYQQKRLLVKAINETDTIIEVNDPTYLEEIASWEGHCENLNMIKIGKELIHYLGVTKTPPYRLQQVKRGYWGTKATAHAANDTIYKLQVTINYGYEGIIPNWALQEKIAEYYAEVCQLNGLAYYDFDGQEFLFNNGHGYYSAKRFFRRMFEHGKEIGVPYIRFTGATLSEGSWHYQSVWNVGGGRNLYDVDTREWGSATSQGKDLRDVTYSNYFPVSFGGNFAIKDTSTVEQYEHIQAISVGYGATYSLGINQKDVESCPQKQAIFKAIRTWEDARWANAFPRSLKKLLRDPKYDWHLETGAEKGTWTLYQSEGGKVLQTYQLKPQDTLSTF